MNRQTLIPAVLLHWVAGELVRYATRTDPVMCSDVTAAVAALGQGKAALVRAEDVVAVVEGVGEGVGV